MTIERKCPECGSVKLTEPDAEGLIDCCDCGIWFDPKHPANNASASTHSENDTSRWTDCGRPKGSPYEGQD